MLSKTAVAEHIELDYLFHYQFLQHASHLPTYYCKTAISTYKQNL